MTAWLEASIFFESSVQIAGDDRHGIPELMGYAGRHLAERGQPFPEFHLFLQPLHLGQVRKGQDNAEGRSLPVGQDRGVEPEPQIALRPFQHRFHPADGDFFSSVS